MPKDAVQIIYLFFIPLSRIPYYRVVVKIWLRLRVDIRKKATNTAPLSPPRVTVVLNAHFTNITGGLIEF